METTLHPDFVNAHHDGCDRARYTFTAAGEKQTGVIYVSFALHGADAVAQAPKAARIAARRAAATSVTLHRID